MTMPARDLDRVRKIRVGRGQVLMHMLEVSGSLWARPGPRAGWRRLRWSMNADSWQVCSV
jgi:hypothetical protein